MEMCDGKSWRPLWFYFAVSGHHGHTLALLLFSLTCKLVTKKPNSVSKLFRFCLFSRVSFGPELYYQTLNDAWSNQIKLKPFHLGKWFFVQKRKCSCANKDVGCYSNISSISSFLDFAVSLCFSICIFSLLWTDILCINQRRRRWEWNKNRKGIVHQRKFFLFASFLLFFLFLLLLPYCSGPLTFYLRAAAASASATNGVFAAAAAADFVRFGAGQLCFLHLQSSFFVQNSIFCLSQFYVSLFEAFLLS